MARSAAPPRAGRSSRSSSTRVRAGDPRDFDPARRIDLHSGGETYAYAIADVDLDGHADLVLARIYGVRIFPGGPDGVRPDHWYELPITTGYCMQVHVADLNRDGWLDLVALVQTYDDRAETMADSTRIFWGGPDGYSLERSTVLPTTSYGAGYLADFDRDGFLDLAWLERDGTLAIMFGGPDGFPTQRVERVSLGTSSWALHLGAADLDGDGWLDIVVGIAGHYARSKETMLILWGGPEGYDLARSTRYDAGYSPGQPTAARLGSDEALTLILPAYSSEAARELPWELLRFQGREIDHAATRRIQGYGSCHVLPIDLDGDGWTDLLVSNHRRNEVHDADAIVYWGGPDGIDEARATHLPGWGPHYLTMRDPGNAHRSRTDRVVRVAGARAGRAAGPRLGHRRRCPGWHGAHDRGPRRPQPRDAGASPVVERAAARRPAPAPVPRRFRVTDRRSIAPAARGRVPGRPRVHLSAGALTLTGGRRPRLRSPSMRGWSPKRNPRPTFAAPCRPSSSRRSWG